ncbi:MAG: hypothetical protein JNL12_03495 [Planctomycetes bacterium]|nr:hypothetical protein [Planctomycetota bacterium]
MPVGNESLGWPDWRGPVVQCRHLGDGGLAVDLIAPTAGHTFALLRVEPRQGGVDVVCAHTPPKADFVAQVITPHTIEVPAERLGAVRAVAVYVTQVDGGTRLALTTARP